MRRLVMTGVSTPSSDPAPANSKSKQVDIYPKGVDPQDIQGKQLSADRRHFLVSYNTGTTPSGSFIWKNYHINLETKEFKAVK